MKKLIPAIVILIIATRVLGNDTTLKDDAYEGVNMFAKCAALYDIVAAGTAKNEQEFLNDDMHMQANGAKMAASYLALMGDYKIEIVDALYEIHTHDINSSMNDSLRNKEDPLTELLPIMEVCTQTSEIQKEFVKEMRKILYSK